LIRTILNHEQWERIAPELPGKAGDPGATASDNRLFIEAVLWIARTGAPWRDLPSAFGKWYSASTRASCAGRRKASGSGFSKPCRTIPISNTSSSTRRTSGFISMAPAQKGDSKSGHRQVARRPDHEDCGACRCARQSRAKLSRDFKQINRKRIPLVRVRVTKCPIPSPGFCQRIPLAKYSSAFSSSSTVSWSPFSASHAL
jgi:hypothetical protein